MGGVSSGYGLLEYGKGLQERIDDNRKEELWKMAHRLAESFQRASSQVEGRNGYLSYINHANRGIG